MIPPPRHSESGVFAEFWRALNQLRDYAVSIRPARGTGTTVRETSQGTIVNAVPPTRQVEQTTGGVLGLKMFRVHAVHSDHLDCQETIFDNAAPGFFIAAPGPSVVVAKPYKLRTFPFHLKTVDGLSYEYDSAIQRRASDGVNEETQTITPSYMVVGSGRTGAANTRFDVIWAVNISQAEPRDYVKASINAAGTSVDWLDINVDGRAWAMKSLTAVT